MQGSVTPWPSSNVTVSTGALAIEISGSSLSLVAISVQRKSSGEAEWADWSDGQPRFTDDTYAKWSGNALSSQQFRLLVNGEQYGAILST